MDAIKFLTKNCGFSCGDPDSEISRAWAEIEAMAADAERYRFFRDALLDYGDNRLAVLDDLPQPECPADFDAAIDAAMHEQGANDELSRPATAGHERQRDREAGSA